MGCSTARSQCSIDGVFAAVASPQCGQFLNPSNFQAEQIIYDASFKDLINNYGIPVEYYINSFNLSAGDTLYGEHPTATFYGPVKVMMYVELTENAIKLSKYGFASDDELTGYVHIQTFFDTISTGDFYIQTSTGELIQYEDYITYIQTELNENITTEEPLNLITEDSIKEINELIEEKWDLYNRYIENGQAIEPKSGDLIQLSPLGCDRPNGRGAKVFEITERTDQDIQKLNPLLGHYVYRLKAKRYEYSFEPGAPIEPQNQQVFENTFSGKLSSNIPDEVQSEAKSYPGNIDEQSRTTVLDMSVNKTDIYGDYY
jgi:predicted lactoylglutathione lyase